MPLDLPDLPALQIQLDALRAEYGVPGAVAGIAHGDHTIVAASGVARLPDGPAITADTLFLIASVTKVWTATMVMQLVEEGRVGLDQPVNNYLKPPLRLADNEVADTVTVRQLLCHTGGFYGDADEPDGDEDDAVLRTVEGYDALEQVHRPGTLFSYSNAGYNVLGRLVECIDETTWDEALATRLLKPLGLHHTSTRIAQTATFPLAVGHEPKGPDTLELEPVSTWLDPRGSGPCGGTLATTAGDLLRFGQMHARDGVSRDGQKILAAEFAQLMRTPQAIQPDPSESANWGLGWGVTQSGAPQVVEHGGNTCGQHSQLYVVPHHDLAVCVLANGDSEGRLREVLTKWILEQVPGVSLPAIPEPVDTQAPLLEGAVGRYRRSDEVTFVVGAGEDGPELTVETSGETAEHVATFSSPLQPTKHQGTYLFTMPPLTRPVTANFVSENGDRPTHLAFGLRVAPRLAEERTTA